MENALREKNTSYVSTPNNVSKDDCNDVRSAIGHWKCGKSAGSNELKGKLIIHALPRLQVILALFDKCFTFMLVHRHLPDKPILVDVVPIPKEKCGSITVTTMSLLSLQP